jgi:hypothetical protein
MTKTKTDPDIAPEPVRGETAVAVRQAGGIQLTDWDSLREFAGAVVKSGQYKNWTSAPQVAITIQTGAELGFSPIRSLAAFYTPPGGKPKLMGEAALALIRSSKVCSRGPKVYNEGAGDERAGCIKFIRRDDPDQELMVERYTMADAKAVGLDKKWKHARENKGKATDDEMLVWRAVARAGTRHFSDVLMGLGNMWELADPSDIPVDAPASTVRTVEAEVTIAAEQAEPDPLLADAKVEEGDETPAAHEHALCEECNGCADAECPDDDVHRCTCELDNAEAAAQKEEAADPSSGCPGCASPADPVKGTCPDCGFPDSEGEVTP